MIYSKIFETKTTDMANELNTFNKEHPEYKYRRMDVLVPYNDGTTIVMVTYETDDVIDNKLTAAEIAFIENYVGDKVRSFSGLNAKAKNQLGRTFTLPEVENVVKISKKNSNYYLSKEN